MKLVEPSGAMRYVTSILGVAHSGVKPKPAHRSRGQGNSIAVTAIFPIHKMQPFWVQNVRPVTTGALNRGRALWRDTERARVTGDVCTG